MAGEVASADQVNQNFSSLADAIEANLNQLNSFEEADLPNQLEEISRLLSTIQSTTEQNAQSIELIKQSVDQQANVVTQLSNIKQVTLSTRELFPANTKQFSLVIEQNVCDGEFYLTHLYASGDLSEDPGANRARSPFTAWWGFDIPIAQTGVRFSASVDRTPTDASISIPGGLLMPSPIVMNVYPISSTGFFRDQPMILHFSGRCESVPG
ncbi:MAG: hypothetical protein AAF541_10565 [Pseudomonadota bacterium]